MKLLVLLIFLSFITPALAASQQPSCCEAFFYPSAGFYPCAYIQSSCFGYRPVWTRSWIQCAPWVKDFPDALVCLAENFQSTCCVCTKTFPADGVWYSTCCNYQHCQDCMVALLHAPQQVRDAPSWLRCNNCHRLLDLKSLFKAATGKDIDTLVSDTESQAGSAYTWLEGS